MNTANMIVLELRLVREMSKSETVGPAELRKALALSLGAFGDVDTSCGEAVMAAISHAVNLARWAAQSEPTVVSLQIPLTRPEVIEMVPVKASGEVCASSDEIPATAAGPLEENMEVWNLKIDTMGMGGRTEVGEGQLDETKTMMIKAFPLSEKRVSELGRVVKKFEKVPYYVDLSFHIGPSPLGFIVNMRDSILYRYLHDQRGGEARFVVASVLSGAYVRPVRLEDLLESAKIRPDLFLNMMPIMVQICATNNFKNKKVLIGSDRSPKIEMKAYMRMDETGKANRTDLGDPLHEVLLTGAIKIAAGTIMKEATVRESHISRSPADSRGFSQLFEPLVLFEVLHWWPDDHIKYVNDEWIKSVLIAGTEQSALERLFSVHLGSAPQATVTSGRILSAGCGGGGPRLLLAGP
jgi:hypothetical protein